MDVRHGFGAHAGMVVQVSRHAGQIQAIKAQLVEVLRHGEIDPHVPRVNQRLPTLALVTELRHPEVVVGRHRQHGEQTQGRGRDSLVHRVPIGPQDFAQQDGRRDGRDDRAHVGLLGFLERPQRLPRSTATETASPDGNHARQPHPVRHPPPVQQQERQRGDAEQHQLPAHGLVLRGPFARDQPGRPVAGALAVERQLPDAVKAVATPGRQANIAGALVDVLIESKLHARLPDGFRAPQRCEGRAVLRSGQLVGVVVVALQDAAVDLLHAAEIPFRDAAATDHARQIGAPEVPLGRDDPVGHSRGVGNTPRPRREPPPPAGHPEPQAAHRHGLRNLSPSPRPAPLRGARGRRGDVSLPGAESWGDSRIRARPSQCPRPVPRSYGNPRRVPKPSRDGPRRAKLAGFPRD